MENRKKGRSLDVCTKQRDERRERDMGYSY
jgi:hypothetical protein